MIAAVAERRKAKRQHGHQHAGRRGVIRRLRPRDALDRASRAKFFLVVGELLFERVGEEGRDFSAARRQGANREADRRTAQPGFP